MINAKWDEVGKALIRSTRVTDFEEAIKKPLKESITSLLASDGLPLSESPNIILLLIFTHIDLLGYLYKGKNSSSNSVEFMREYIGRIDTRYKEVGGLLYNALRHGYVHLATPKRMQLKNGMILDFSFGSAIAGKRQGHLKVTKREEIERVGKLEICRLFVNLSQLYEDLLSAMDKYAEDIRHNQVLSDIFWKAFETRRNPEKAKEEKLLNKPYIQASDFAFVREQISNL